MTKKMVKDLNSNDLLNFWDFSFKIKSYQPLYSIDSTILPMYIYYYQYYILTMLKYYQC